jgi:hypothetical protein
MESPRVAAEYTAKISNNAMMHIIPIEEDTDKVRRNTSPPNRYLSSTPDSVIGMQLDKPTINSMLTVPPYSESLLIEPTQLECFMRHWCTERGVSYMGTAGVSVGSYVSALTSYDAPES